MSTPKQWVKGPDGKMRLSSTARPEPASKELITATVRAFGGKRITPESESRALGKMTVPQLVATVVAGTGSKAAAAAALGITMRTMQRWASGHISSPKAANRNRLEAEARGALRRSRLGKAREAKIRAGVPWTITAEVSVSGDKRNRKLLVGDHRPTGLAAALDAYLAGDDQGAGDAVAAAVWDYGNADGLALDGDVDGIGGL